MLPFVFLDVPGFIHPYGIACMLAFFAWDHVIMKQAIRRGYDRADFRVLTVLLFVVGWFFAWWIDAVFYHPEGQSIAATLFAFRNFSSTGAIVGATAGAIFWSRVHVRKEDGRWRISRRERPLPMLPISEVILSTWPVAWSIGRLGCALVHDHPGIVVAKGTLGSLFAVAWPRDAEDGVHHVLGPLHVVTGGSDARFDLGLLEFFVIGAIAIAFSRMWKREIKLGTYTIVGCLVYGPIRFMFDFLRTVDGPGGDRRHAGLTFAQYWSLTIVALGLVLLMKRMKERKSAASPTLATLNE